MLPFIYDNSVFTGLGNCAADLTAYNILRARLLPSFALDISNNEGCGWTHAELHSYLVDGITVGGHTIKDEDVVRNVKFCWEGIGVSSAECSDDILCYHYICMLHSALTKGLLPQNNLGVFRNTNVIISGTDCWECIPPEFLRETFSDEITVIRSIGNPIEQAVVAQLWLSYRQFFADGNKRVSRMLTNALLHSKALGVFAVPSRGHVEFTQLLCEFYDTANATKLCEFIVKHCLHLFDLDGKYIPPQVVAAVKRMRLE